MPKLTFFNYRIPFKENVDKIERFQVVATCRENGLQAYHIVSYGPNDPQFKNNRALRRWLFKKAELAWNDLPPDPNLVQQAKEQANANV